LSHNYNTLNIFFPRYYLIFFILISQLFGDSPLHPECRSHMGKIKIFKQLNNYKSYFINQFYKIELDLMIF